MFRNFLSVNGLKQIELCKYLGLSDSFMSQIVKGVRPMPQDKLKILLNNDQGWDVSMLNNPAHSKKIPLYDDVATIGGVNEQAAVVDNAARPTEWIDAGDWFPAATSAIHHYGDSMVEYPSGCVLVLKRVNDPRLIINGQHYVIETSEYRITKQILDDGDCIVAYSTNQETYPDGRQIHSPIRIPKEAIRHLDLVLGCVIKKFDTPVKIR